jgi:hypothetical protein
MPPKRKRQASKPKSNKLPVPKRIEPRTKSNDGPKTKKRNVPEKPKKAEPIPSEDSTESDDSLSNLELCPADSTGDESAQLSPEHSIGTLDKQIGESLVHGRICEQIL